MDNNVSMGEVNDIANLSKEFQAFGNVKFKVVTIRVNWQAIDMLNGGQIVGTAAYFPYTASACMVDILNRAHQGEEVPRVVLNDCRGSDDGGGTEQPLVVNSDNVDSYEPVY